MIIIITMYIHVAMYMIGPVIVLVRWAGKGKT